MDETHGDLRPSSCHSGLLMIFFQHNAEQQFYMNFLRIKRYVYVIFDIILLNRFTKRFTPTYNQTEISTEDHKKIVRNF